LLAPNPVLQLSGTARLRRLAGAKSVNTVRFASTPKDGPALGSGPAHGLGVGRRSVDPGAALALLRCSFQPRKRLGPPGRGPIGYSLAGPLAACTHRSRCNGRTAPAGSTVPNSRRPVLRGPGIPVASIRFHPIAHCRQLTAMSEAQDACLMRGGAVRSSARPLRRVGAES
jgi:hypothetical protein